MRHLIEQKEIIAEGDKEVRETLLNKMGQKKRDWASVPVIVFGDLSPEEQQFIKKLKKPKAIYYDDELWDIDPDKEKGPAGPMTDDFIKGIKKDKMLLVWVADKLYLIDPQGYNYARYIAKIQGLR